VQDSGLFLGFSARGIVEKAKDLGFNLSKLCENYLKQAIAKMEGPDCPDDSDSSVNASFQEGFVRL
jgi:hypothetical protein